MIAAVLLFSLLLAALVVVVLRNWAADRASGMPHDRLLPLRLWFHAVVGMAVASAIAETRILVVPFAVAALAEFAFLGLLRAGLLRRWIPDLPGASPADRDVGAAPRVDGEADRPA